MVSNTLMRIVANCWKPSNEGDNSSRGGDDNGRADGLLWYKDSGQHVNGEFSMAVIQANNLLEDCSQIESGPMSLLESGPQGTFVGIYDGHGGPEAARFVNQHLFENIKSMFCLFGLIHLISQLRVHVVSYYTTVICVLISNCGQSEAVLFVYVCLQLLAIFTCIVLMFGLFVKFMSLTVSFHTIYRWL